MRMEELSIRFYQGLSNSSLLCIETSIELSNCTFDSNKVQTIKDAGVGITAANAYMQIALKLLHSNTHCTPSF